MKRFLFSSIFVFLFSLGFAQSVYVKSIVNTRGEGMEAFSNLEISPLHGFLDKNGQFDGIFAESDIVTLRSLGYQCEIQISDLESHYTNPNRQSTRIENVNPCFGGVANYPVPENFSQGSMGGYYTHDEVMQELDNMRNLYPNLITAKTQIGNHVSIEGRPIYWLKISDNPEIAEDEPQVLYTAIHHSQEPASVQQLIFYMYYLLENYDTNPEVKYLVDHTEMYFIPIVNPDGYVYNETENPDGGGLWRKNRRDNEGLLSGYGVDLNRNYNYAFGWDEIGSSSIGQHPWHRGDSAFSEPETQAVKEFLESHTILLDLNWHTYGDMLIYPWNYESNNTDDSTLYVMLCEDMTRENHYRFGTCYETYGYQSNGDADDWGYGATDTKNSIISLTGECGNGDDGFWPDPDRIVDICLGTIRMNLELAHYAGHYARITDLQSDIISSQNGHMKFKIQSIGLSNPAVFTISYNALTDNISFGNAVTSGNLSHLDTFTDSISYTINADYGELIGMVINYNNGNFTYSDTVYKYYGHTVTLFEDACESMDNWDADDWDITDADAYSGTYSISESPNGPYGSFQTSEITPTQSFDLNGYTHAVAQFYCKYDLENNYDRVQFMVSNDGGDNWTAVCGRNSTIGTDDEEEGEPVYHNFTQGWIFEEISLADYIGQEIEVKLRFKSDQNNTRDGFYFDDFKIIALDPSIVSSTEFGSEEVSIYPNPAVSTIHFNLSQNQYPAMLEIFNLNGQKMTELLLDSESISLDISDWENGLYIYRLSCKNKTIEAKFSILHN
jgi:carboxypeptidase T